MPRKKRLKLGDIYEIPLPTGKFAYARLFREYTLAIYQGFYENATELPENAVYFRFLTVYKDLLQDGEWKIVANRPFPNAEAAWPPPKCVVDAITLRGALYYKGKITPCTYEECAGLEVAAVWDREHIIQMLLGDSRIDASLRKPVRP